MMVSCKQHSGETLHFYFTQKVYYKPWFTQMVLWRERSRVMFSRMTRDWKEITYKRPNTMQEVRSHQKGQHGQIQTFVPTHRHTHTHTPTETPSRLNQLCENSSYPPKAYSTHPCKGKGNLKMVGKCSISTCPCPTLPLAQW